MLAYYLKIKKGKSHIAPINPLPLLPSGPGGVQRDLVVWSRQMQKYNNKSVYPNREENREIGSRRYKCRA